MTIGQAIVGAPNHFEAGKAATRTALNLIRDGHRDGALKLSPREVPWLDLIEKTLDSVPGSESGFISEMMGEVDTTKFVASDYGVG